MSGKSLVTATQAMAAFLAACDEEDIAAVLDTIRQKALDTTGRDHREYATLLLQYTVGRPRTAPQTVAKGGPSLKLGTAQECLESLQDLEDMVAEGRMSVSDAGERERRIRLALEAHRSLSAEKALKAMEDNGALTFVAPAAGSSADKAAAYQKFLDSQENSDGSAE